MLQRKSSIQKIHFLNNMLYYAETNPVYGYEMSKLSNLSLVSVYKYLYELDINGYVKTDLVTHIGKPPRKRYTLTIEGQDFALSAIKKYFSLRFKDLYLVKQNLSGLNLNNKNLSGAFLNGAILENTTLRYVNLNGANLTETKLQNADLSGANLSNTTVINSNLRGANLHGVNFHNANLRMCNLAGANLTNVNFSSANLSSANLNNTIINSTDFNEAMLSESSLSQINFSEIIGIDNINHKGPCSIDFQAMEKYHPLPKRFLKGIGLNNWEIEQTKLYQKDLSQEAIAEILNTVHQLRTDSPIQVHNLFISYAHKDSEFVDMLAMTLDDKGTRFWRDINDLPDAPAGPLDRVILKEMKSCIVLLILSEHSISSDWVRFEMESAAKIGIDEGREVLLPIALDDSWKDYNWPIKLRDRIFDYNIIDFSEWQDKSIYKQRFEQVLEGLDLFYKEV